MLFLDWLGPGTTSSRIGLLITMKRRQKTQIANPISEVVCYTKCTVLLEQCDSFKSQICFPGSNTLAKFKLTAKIPQAAKCTFLMMQTHLEIKMKNPKNMTYTFNMEFKQKFLHSIVVSCKQSQGTSRTHFGTLSS